MPIPTCFATTSFTARAMVLSNSAGSTVSSRSRRLSSAMTSGGRGRLPTCVVSIRSVLRCMTLFRAFVLAETGAIALLVEELLHALRAAFLGIGQAQLIELRHEIILRRVPGHLFLLAPGMLDRAHRGAVLGE